MVIQHTSHQSRVAVTGPQKLASQSSWWVEFGVGMVEEGELAERGRKRRDCLQRNCSWICRRRLVRNPAEAANCLQSPKLPSATLGQRGQQRRVHVFSALGVRESMRIVVSSVYDMGFRTSSGCFSAAFMSEQPRERH